MLTIYIRKRFLDDMDVLEHAEKIGQIFQYEELEFADIKEGHDSGSRRDVLIVTPPISYLNKIFKKSKSTASTNSDELKSDGDST